LAGVGRERVLVSAIEHDSVLKATAAETIPVDRRGVVELAALERLLAARAEPALVALMLANNETGAIQPVADAARIAHAHGALLHCDAVQAAGKIAVDFKALGVDLMTVSAHQAGQAGGRRRAHRRRSCSRRRGSAAADRSAGGARGRRTASIVGWRCRGRHTERHHGEAR
jgi:hypothetical protein